MSKHTPGPWKWGVNGGLVRSDNGLLILASPVLTSIGGEETNANASLMAAAPDMLAALKALAESVADMGGLNSLELSDLERARAAIAKAEGQS